MKASWLVSLPCLVLAASLPTESARLTARDKKDFHKYAPEFVTCPNPPPAAREAKDISQQEKTWLAKRRANVRNAYLEYLEGNGAIPGFNATAFLVKYNSKKQATSDDYAGDDTDADSDSDSEDADELGRIIPPVLGIAVSGGGYRSFSMGAGVLQAFDGRTSKPETPNTGGLLQSTTYFGALSGGGWLLNSLYAHGFPTVSKMRENEDLWQFQYSIFQGPSERGVDVLSYWKDVKTQVDLKEKTGWDTSATDYWGVALGYQMLDKKTAGAGRTFSSLADESFFARDANVPFPIVVALQRSNNDVTVNFDRAVMEFNPYELGSWDTSVYAFAPLKYVGSNFVNGKVDVERAEKGKKSPCVTGLDQMSFVLGTSSSLFNALLVRASEEKVPKIVVETVGSLDEDVANWDPNPFYKFPESRPVNIVTNDPEMGMFDGGWDLQNLPLQPLLVKERKVETIFAVDGSGDTESYYPNGTALRATEAKAKSKKADFRFPPIPSERTFMNLGFHRRPAFFGCHQTDAPLVVYLPNAPYTFHANLSTFDPDFELGVRNAAMDNAFQLATQGQGSLDANWPACLSCATLHHALTRNLREDALPKACTACFKSYCWDGTNNNTKVASYPDTPFLKLVEVSAARRGPSWNPLLGLLGVSVVLAML